MSTSEAWELPCRRARRSSEQPADDLMIRAIKTRTHVQAVLSEDRAVRVSVHRRLLHVPPGRHHHRRRSLWRYMFAKVGRPAQKTAASARGTTLHNLLRPVCGTKSPRK